MDFVDQLERLERLRQQGMLNDTEFEQAKAKLLAGDTSTDADVGQIQLSGLRKELELARVDRAWNYEKETYMVIQRYGAKRPPSVSSGVTGIVLGVSFGGFLLWLGSTMNSGYGASSTPMSSVVPLAGLFFILGSLWAGIDECNKALQYSSAEQAYSRQREQINRHSS